jgi:exosortase
LLDRPLDSDEENGLIWGLPLVAWVQIVAVGVLMAALFRFNLARLWGKTNPINGQDSNWQHAIFVPLIGIYYLFIHREELLRAAAMPRVRERWIRVLSLVGVGIMVVAGAMFVRAGETGTPLVLVGTLLAGLVVPAVLPTSTAFGTVLLFEGLLVFAYGIFPGQNDYIKDLGMVVTIFGAATLLAGWPVMKIAWFPIAFLVVALPWPELVYSKLAWPLQKLAASAAVGTLRACGVTAQNFGTKITMFDKAGMPRSLNVAEACAGLKSVMTFLMVGATVAFLSQRVLWEKLFITASAIPIAIFCNVVRVCGQGLLDRYVSREWSEGFAHQFAGLVMVIPGFFLILLVGWLLDQLFIEEVEPGSVGGGGGGEAAAAAAAAAAVNRSKRMIVEVPRKKLVTPPANIAAATAAPASDDSGLEVATPGVPVVAAESVPALAPTAARGAGTPAGGPGQAAGPRPSTLKAPPPAAARPATAAGAAEVAPGGSTLKPPTKPAAPRSGVTPPPSAGGAKPTTLKPSTLKPPVPRAAAAGSTAPVQGPASSSGAPRQVAPPPQRLKPPAATGVPAPSPAARHASATPPAVPGPRQASVPPAKPKAPAAGAGNGPVRDDANGPRANGEERS